MFFNLQYKVVNSIDSAGRSPWVWRGCELILSGSAAKYGSRGLWGGGAQSQDMELEQAAG